MLVCVGQRSFNSYLKHQPNNNNKTQKNGHCIQQQQQLQLQQLQQHQQSNASFAHIIFVVVVQI